MMKLRYIVLALLAVSLAGCFGEPAAVPQDAFYTLPELTADTKTQRFNNLSVDQIRATGIYNERALLYINKSSPLSIHRYHYHHWAMPPAQLIRQRLKHYLATSQLARTVTDYKPGLQTDAVIRGTLLQYEQVIDAGKISVQVTIEFAIRQANQRQNKQYTATVASASPAFEDSAEAFGMALKNILHDFLQDLANL